MFNEVKQEIKSLLMIGGIPFISFILSFIFGFLFFDGIIGLYIVLFSVLFGSLVAIFFIIKRIKELI